MNISFCNKLKQLRKKHNVSQIEISEYLNVSRATYSNYENGITEPSINSIICIAKFYNVSLDFLLTDTKIEFDKISFDDDFQLNIPDFSKETLLNSLYNKKNKYLKLLEYNNTLINNYISEIDKIIISLKEQSNTDNKNSNVEFSQELSISSKTIDKIINLDKYNLKNSIDLDFYKNNNLKICDSLNSNFAYSNQEQFEYISVYGNISCGALKYTNGSIEDTFYLKKQDLKYDKNDYFILQIDGESMNKLYKNGDYILIHKTKNYEGYKPYVFILGDEATLKYIDIDLENQSIILIPHSTNSSYQKQILKFEDLNSTNFGILGTVEGVLNFID